LIIIVHWIG